MKGVYLLLAFISVVCGVIGLLLPIVPTVPFLLLAAFLVSKGSPSMYNWLNTHLGEKLMRMRRRVKLTSDRKVQVSPDKYEATVNRKVEGGRKF